MEQELSSPVFSPVSLTLLHRHRFLETLHKQKLLCTTNSRQSHAAQVSEQLSVRVLGTRPGQGALIRAGVGGSSPAPWGSPARRGRAGGQSASGDVSSPAWTETSRTWDELRKEGEKNETVASRHTTPLLSNPGIVLSERTWIDRN